jgi:hypothetical protein
VRKSTEFTVDEVGRASSRTPSARVSASGGQVCAYRDEVLPARTQDLMSLQEHLHAPVRE